MMKLLLGLLLLPVVFAFSNHSRVRRAGDSGTWPGGRIPYEFKPNFPRQDREKFLEATRYIQERSCVRFTPKAPGDQYWLILVLGGCCGTVGGRWKHGKGRGQEATFSSGLPLPFYLHELGHTFWFPHEQDRPDRDQYIYWDSNKDKEKCKNNGLAGSPAEMDQIAVDIPFDYVSLMADWTECYWPKPPAPKNIPLGPGGSDSRTFSVLDFERINAVHGCKGCFGYRFIKSSKLGRNSNAYLGGWELDRKPFYICRTYHEGHIIIGKARLDERKCFIAFDGGEHEHRDGFSVLTIPRNDASRFRWVRGTGRIQKNAIKGGRTRDRETLYIGRCLQKQDGRETMVPGFYFESKPSELRIPFGGWVRTCRNFEVLVCNR